MSVPLHRNSYYFSRLTSYRYLSVADAYEYSVVYHGTSTSYSRTSTDRRDFGRADEIDSSVSSMMYCEY